MMMRDLSKASSTSAPSEPDSSYHERDPTLSRQTLAPDIDSFRPTTILPLSIARLMQSSISATILYHPSDNSRYGLTGTAMPLLSMLGGDLRMAVTQRTKGRLGDESCSWMRRMMGRCALPISRSYRYSS